MVGDLTFLEIANSGTIKHGTLGEVPSTNQVDPFGRMLGLDNRDLVNDAPGALGVAGKRLGRGGALGLSKAFWKEFMNNSSFFTSGNGNATSGGTTALSVGGLKQAETAFALLKNPDGELMGGKAALLVVPTALRTDAAQLMTSARLYGTTTADKPQGDADPFADRHEVADTGYPQDTPITGNSATAYCLLASPNAGPVIEVAFLNGQRVPLIEAADTDFNQLGIQFRGTWNFGVAKQECRGGVRAAGA